MLESLLGGFGAEFFADILEDDTTKKPVVPALVAAAVTSAPIVADKPAVIAAPLKTPEEIPVEVILDEVTEISVNDEKIAEPVTEILPEKVESDAVNEIVPVVANEIPVVETVLAVEPTVVKPLADKPAVITSVTSAPVKATSEEEDSLIDGIVGTFLDDADDGKLITQNLRNF